jgi:hypothetical protein
VSRLLILLLVCFVGAGCSSKTAPPPSRDYRLEALENQVRQMSIFIDNWSGYDQKYSRINSLGEYKSVRREILSSPAYASFPGRAAFQAKVDQFDTVVKRYETWIEERTALLDQMNGFISTYQAGQKELFSRNARPLRVGPYELAVETSYFRLEPDDPDKAYASARYVGLSQLNIIAASRQRPLQLPSLKITGFVVAVKIRNASTQQILRPHGFVLQRQTKTSNSGSIISRSQRHYLVNFSDEVKNRYDFAHAVDVTNKESDKGIRPGETAVWTYEFNEDNFPLETVRLFQVIYPAAVFGRSLRLNIPTEAIPRPEIPPRLSPG